MSVFNNIELTTFKYRSVGVHALLNNIILEQGSAINAAEILLNLFFKVRNSISGHLRVMMVIPVCFLPNLIRPRVNLQCCVQCYIKVANGIQNPPMLLYERAVTGWPSPCAFTSTVSGALSLSVMASAPFKSSIAYMVLPMLLNPNPQ